MRRVCAWCQQALGEQEEHAREGVITHGICSRCAVEITGDAPRTVRQILDYLQEPVFVIDADGVVHVANQRAQELLGKETTDIESRLGGDAFECSYSQLEGGCGKTVHCKTCAIRNTVMDTLSSGHGYQGVPAYQSIETKDGPRILRFSISTEKLGNRILLRIDQVGDR